MTRKKTDNDYIDQFHEYGIYIPTRTIKLDLDGEGDDVSLGHLAASRLIKNLAVLEAINQDPITIKMNCDGGSVIDGLAMYDAIQACKSHVTIEVLGSAQSMAAIVLQAADDRAMYPFSRLMLHDGELSTSGPQIEVEREIDTEKFWRARMNKLVADRCGMKPARVARKVAHGWFLTAEQALDEKLIDRIIV